MMENSKIVNTLVIFRKIWFGYLNLNGAKKEKVKLTVYEFLFFFSRPSPLPLISASTGSWNLALRVVVRLFLTFGVFPFADRTRVLIGRWVVVIDWVLAGLQDLRSLVLRLSILLEIFPLRGLYWRMLVLLVWVLRTVTSHSFISRFIRFCCYQWSDCALSIFTRSNVGWQSSTEFVCFEF